jgi:hypothetical protein
MAKPNAYPRSYPIFVPRHSGQRQSSRAYPCTTILVDVTYITDVTTYALWSRIRIHSRPKDVAASSGSSSAQGARRGAATTRATRAWTIFRPLCAAVRVIGKTLSTQAAARTVPHRLSVGTRRAAHAVDQSTRAATEIHVHVYAFSELLSSARKGRQELKVGVSHFADSFTIVARARAVRSGCEPGGDPGGPGGEAQRPDGGSTAWTVSARRNLPGVGKGLRKVPVAPSPTGPAPP